MLSASLLDEFLAQGRMGLLGALLVLWLGAMLLYAAFRALRSAYAEQRRRLSRCGLTGRQAVGRLLEHGGLSSVGIDEGAAIDQYDMLRKRVRLRTESGVSSSVAALAIAAHEVGHAEQFARGYWAAHATRCLLVLLLFGAVVVLVYPFAATIAGAGDVNFTGLLALGVLVALFRLPVAIALERDANRRGQRLLDETGLADETEHDGIARLLRAGLRVHVVFSAWLVLLIGAGLALMSLVENGLDTPTLVAVHVAPAGELPPGQPVPPMPAIDLGDGINYPLVAVLVSVATVWWTFSGKTRTAPARHAADADHEVVCREGT